MTTSDKERVCLIIDRDVNDKLSEIAECEVRSRSAVVSILIRKRYDEMKKEDMGNE